jgi:hypothetical protein
MDNSGPSKVAEVKALFTMPGKNMVRITNISSQMEWEQDSFRYTTIFLTSIFNVK